MRSGKLPLGILLLSGFIDYAGIAIVYPLLAYMLFDPSFHFLSAETSSSMRGLMLGILIALSPLVQFFLSPILGSLSDLKGRKKLLLWSFSAALLGYAFAVLSVAYESLALLALYRVLIGIGCANCSIVSAIVADISTHEQKAKHYGLLDMSIGAGFTLGPFLSGLLAASFGLIAPFATAFCLVALNLWIVWWKLDETHPVSEKGKVRVLTAIYQVREAARSPGLRYIFLALLIFSFGWSFFTEFVPLFLISRYGFDPAQVGLYYGYAGVFYALSAGFLIYPIIKRIGIQRALFLSMFLGGVYLLLFLFVKTPGVMWLYLPLSQFLLSFAYPAIAAFISNRVSDSQQGEVMGVYQSLIALAMTLTPFFCGSLVGNYPSLTVIVSGLLIALSGLTILLQRESAYDLIGK